MNEYAEFLVSKRRVWEGRGIASAELPPALFDWQQAITRWALRKGRAAIFADCGLGKTPMQLAWADAVRVHTRGGELKPTLILAPLCVAEQTIHEGEKFGIRVAYVRTPSDIHDHAIVTTNYERLDAFDPQRFGAVVLDESSILKAFDGKTRQRLIDMFKATPYRLCCTATPSPNDIAELANHAEFLGLMTRAEFLATWFVHDDEGWRMKGHAVEPFYRWLASWAIALRKPSDIGFSDAGFELPPLHLREAVVECDREMGDGLFPGMGIKGLSGRLIARRASLDARVAAVVDLVKHGGQWLLWCGLNTEAEALAAQIPGAVNVQGSDTYAEKVGAVEGFINGSIRVLISKSKILGFGMNFQHCYQMAFVGLGDSYESYYQCIRRCWRFGQQWPVFAWIVVSDAERIIVANVQRKELAAGEMTTQLLTHLSAFEREELIA